MRRLLPQPAPVDVRPRGSNRPRRTLALAMAPLVLCALLTPLATAPALASGVPASPPASTPSPLAVQMLDGIDSQPATPTWPSRIVDAFGVELRVPTNWPVADVRAQGACPALGVPSVVIGVSTATAPCARTRVGTVRAVQIVPATAASVPSPVPADIHGMTVVMSASQAAAGQLAIALPRGGAVLIPAASDLRLAQQIAATIRVGHSADPSATPATAGAAAGVAATHTGTATWNPSVDVLAIDSCTVPTTAEMQYLHDHYPYRGISLYLGGIAALCPARGITSAWVTSVVAQGWHIIPIYAGYQAPCPPTSAHNVPEMSTTVQGEEAQAIAAAQDAASLMAAYGLQAGNPVYYDMEAYQNQVSGCVGHVDAYLQWWTLELHALGFVSGVYGSLSSTIAGLLQGGSGYVEPDVAWIGDWTNPTTTPTSPDGNPPLQVGLFGGHQRIWQYASSKTVQLSATGPAASVDLNIVDAPLAPSTNTPFGTFPGPPTNAEAYVVSTGSATDPAIVTWSPPLGHTPVARYQVVESPGGQTVTTTALSATVPGPFTAGTTYTFAVSALGSAGWGQPMQTENLTFDPAATASTYHPITSTIVLDTRHGVGVPQAPLAAYHQVVLTLGHLLPLDSHDATTATAVTVQVLALSPEGSGWVSVGRSGAPIASDLTLHAHQNSDALVTARIDAATHLRVLTSATTQLVVFVTGYYAPTTGDYFHRMTAKRFLDSRIHLRASTLSPGAAVRLQMTGPGSLVPTGTRAVAVELSTVNSAASGYLYVYGATQGSNPTTALGSHQIPTDLAIVPLDATGGMRLLATGRTDVVGDIIGYFDTAPAGGKKYTAFDPQRLIDTRSGLGGARGLLPAHTAQAFQGADTGPLPSSATVLVGDVTVLGSRLPGVLGLSLPGSSVPTVVTFPPSGPTTAPTMTAVGSVAQSYAFDATSSVSTDLIVDATGYFSP